MTLDGGLGERGFGVFGFLGVGLLERGGEGMIT